MSSTDFGESTAVSDIPGTTIVLARATPSGVFSGAGRPRQRLHRPTAESRRRRGMCAAVLDGRHWPPTGIEVGARPSASAGVKEQLEPRFHRDLNRGTCPDGSCPLAASAAGALCATAEPQHSIHYGHSADDSSEKLILLCPI